MGGSEVDEKNKGPKKENRHKRLFLILSSNQLTTAQKVN